MSRPVGKLSARVITEFAINDFALLNECSRDMCQHYLRESIGQ